MADATFRDLCLDATDAGALAAFWAAALGRTVVDNDDDPDVMLKTTAGARSGLVWINTVPEERGAKARAHLDLRMPVAEPWSWIQGVPGFPFQYWVFNPVPEPKTVKNRLHWDINLDADDPSALVAA